MTLKTFNAIPARPKIVPTDVLIRAYGMDKLIEPVGEAVFDVTFRSRHLKIEFVIIDTGEATLLGLDACEMLGLVQIADAVESTVTSPLIDEFMPTCLPGSAPCRVSTRSLSTRRSVPWSSRREKFRYI